MSTININNPDVNVCESLRLKIACKENFFFFFCIFLYFNIILGKCVYRPPKQDCFNDDLPRWGEDHYINKCVIALGKPQNVQQNLYLLFYIITKPFFVCSFFFYKDEKQN